MQVQRAGMSRRNAHGGEGEMNSGNCGLVFSDAAGARAQVAHLATRIRWLEIRLKLQGLEVVFARRAQDAA
ncbi:hypothetical protein D9M68_727450 [compost metagenome]